MEKESGNLLKYSVLPTCNVAVGHTLKSNQITTFNDSFLVMIFSRMVDNSFDYSLFLIFKQCCGCYVL